MPPATSLLFSGAWQNIRVQAEAAASQQQFDVIWVEHTLVWPFAERLLRLQKGGRPFVICSGHNVEHHVLQRQARSAAHGSGRWYLWRQVRLMQRMEQAAWSASDLIVQCSENDARYTRRCVPQTSVLVMPNGVDTGYFRRRSALPTEPSPTLVLTAGFGYAPNLEGLQWFLRDVFPLVQQKVPEVSFLFAGSCAAAAADVCAPLPKGVRFLSDPVDIRPAFECGWVYVVPLLSGGGSRLKILEAMAMQVPVVSTTLGAEGVPYRSGRDLLLADGAVEFADAVLRLLESATLRHDLTASAQELVLNEYTWGHLTSGLEKSILRHLPDQNDGAADVTSSTRQVVRT
jgi:glycosyltransferase involved in cell wall biosynthesis